MNARISRTCMNHLPDTKAVSGDLLPKDHEWHENRLKRYSRAALTAGGLGLVMVSPALAHTGHATGSGFMSGFQHPLLGADHVAAMVAVGLWSALFSRPASWALPVAFLLAMILGGVLGTMGMLLPGVETGIAASALIIGFAIVLRSPSVVMATSVVAFFAIFHGHAHGAEMPGTANPLIYAAGFVLGTGLLHLSGVGIGSLIRSNLLATRTAGTAVALTGAGFLAGVL